MYIEKYDYSIEGNNAVAELSKGKDWPVVYLISNSKRIYIGETTSASRRMEQHLHNKEKQKYGFKEFRIVFDDEYNKSVILDYEQKLIKCFKSDEKYDVVNKNAGQSSSHEYYQRENFKSKFNELWEELRNIGMADNSLSVLENREIFKYSPYNSLTEEQNAICIDVINDICEKFETKGEGISLINGCAGTGKTVMAISMINSIVNAQYLDISDLTEEEVNSEKVQALLRLKKYVTSSEGKPLSVAFVFPMTGIRKTISKVFRSCGNGLAAKMVVGPSKVVKEKYDIVFVDESHRLCCRKNIQNMKAFDDNCEKLGLDKYKTSQLDWVLKQSKYCVLFYDKDQSIKGADIPYQQYEETINNSKKEISRYSLQTQMRCMGGDSYVSYLKDILACKVKDFKEIINYEFRIFDDVNELVEKIQKYDDDLGLAKTVAGYSWEWKTKPNEKPKDNLDAYLKLKDDGEYDIEIDGNKYIWNLTTEDWMSREDSKYTIGCIHTTQGFDLNYVGVIFGEEIDYDPIKKCITIDTDKFYDKNVKQGCNEDVVKEFIINTYTTIMTRGIKGCYVYACNENLRNYFKKYIRSW